MKVQYTNKNIIVIIFTCLISSSICYSANRWTNRNDDGDQSIFFLDRHQVYCGVGEGLQFFHLYRPTGNTIAYEYQCTQSDAIEPTYYDDYTQWDSTASNEKESTQYLDRHNIQCKTDHALVGFNMERRGSQIRYRFRCSPIKAISCADFNTGPTDGFIGGNIYLDRQYIGVSDGQILTGYKMSTGYYDRGWFRVEGKIYSFKVRYCNIRDVRAEKEQFKNVVQKNKGNNSHSMLRVLDEEVIKTEGAGDDDILYQTTTSYDISNRN
jgi:hypothetical protein